MTIPPGDDFHRLGTQRFADELEPLDNPSAELAAPPAHWVAADGEPISSHPSHLLAREAQPSLVSSGWNELDAQAFISHLDRKALHASRDRNFKHAWIKDPDTGQTRPKYYRTNSAQLTRCQYAVLTHPQRSTVLAIDIHTPPGTTGGPIEAPHTGQTRPKYYRTNSARLTRCQYAVLTHPQRSTVLVIDIDTPSGKTGGTIEALHPEALTKLNTLCAQGFGPAWIGINPIN